MNAIAASARLVALGERPLCRLAWTIQLSMRTHQSMRERNQMSVRSELEEATGLKSEKGEKLAAFKLRLVEAVDDLKEAEYKALPRAARKWVDEAVEAYNKKRE